MVNEDTLKNLTFFWDIDSEQTKEVSVAIYIVSESSVRVAHVISLYSMPTSSSFICSQDNLSS